MKATRLFLILLVAILVCAASSCDVHEFPSAEAPEPGRGKAVLYLRFDDGEFDFLTTVDLSSRGAADPHDFRVTVRLYPLEPSRDGAQRVPSRDGLDYYSATFEASGAHTALSIPLELGAGEYRVAAWADYVADGTSDDLYYDTSDFIEVKLAGASGEEACGHPGNNPFREAWRGLVDIAVDASGKVTMTGNRAGETTTVIPVDMERPLSRYHFVTTDLRKFLESEGARDASAGGSPSLDDYRVVVRYTGYMPSSYNVLADRPVDSRTGVSYEGTLRALDSDRAEVAFDHVFVNHSETSAQVSLELYRRADGTRLSSTGQVDVPLRRGRYTLIEGPLLTTMAGASTGISPDFFGDFNIEIK